MEIPIYNPDNLHAIGVIDEFSSLIWHRKYFEPGKFEISAPATQNNIDMLLNEDFYICRDDSIETGIIEEFSIDEDEDKGDTIIASGHFALNLLSRRSILEQTNFSGTAENAMRALVTQNAVSPADQNREIEFLILENLNGFTENVIIQVTGKRLVDYLARIAKVANFGQRIRFDKDELKLIYEIYKGVDRSIEQATNPYIIFNHEYENLGQCKYTFSNEDKANFVLVAGEGEGDETITASVGSAAGRRRFELYVEARNISSNKGDISPDDYLDLLEQNGIANLTDAAEYFEGEIINLNNTYLDDYDLGDIVTIQNEKWNKSISCRITEIIETIDEGGRTIEPVFGNPKPELADILSK